MFEYKNKAGAICPFNRDNIVLSYGDVVVECDNIEAIFESKIFDEKSLNEMCDELEIE
ncbi:MAG: hypothetical protein R3Y29_02235 [bacterium]